MNFKFLSTLVLAVCAGFFMAQSLLFVSKNGFKIASQTISDIRTGDFKLIAANDFKSWSGTISHKIDNLSKAAFNGIENLANTISLSRTVTIENVSADSEQGGDFSKIVANNLEYEDAIFTNPAVEVLEDFPTNNPDSINQHKFSEDLTIPDTGKVVVANLETMELDLYKDGEVIESIEILSKGRPGTPWETPPGSFEIRHKTENHFSSIGEVWMPYSMQFFGNYFIHGWPHESDGTPVPQGYSGGCIRLSNEDAKKVYEFVSLNTEVIVLGTTAETISSKQTGYYVINNADKFPKTTSQAYLVADLESGDVLFSRDSDKAFSVASITKLMTALVSLETINQYSYTTVSQDAFDTEGWRGNLSAGERILTGDLIYPLLLQSSNDAAEVLAEFSGRSNFMKNLNQRARSLGLSNSYFDDPSGLSVKNISTAEDLFKLTHYIYRYKKFVFDVTQSESYSNEDHDWPNIHRFAGTDVFLGGKNGFTDEARHTLITLVELGLTSDSGNLNNHIGLISDEDLESGVENRKFAIILLQAEQTHDDTQKIVNFIRNNVEYSR